MDTALNTALEDIDRIKDTASSHQRAHVVEVLSLAGNASKALLWPLDALDLGVAEHQPVAALTHSGVDSPILAVGRA
jgi:hypothetical protein